MSPNLPAAPSNRDVSQHILPTSATMMGACVTVIGIVRLIEGHERIETMIDDLAAVAAVLFLVSALLSYVSLRTDRATMSLERRADQVFLGGLVLLVVAGLMLAWEVGQAPQAPGVERGPSATAATMATSPAGPVAQSTT